MLRHLMYLMADTGTELPNTETDQETEQNQEDEEPYDKDRAMKLITKLREQNKTLKATTKEMQGLQSRVEEMESKDKTELEKASGKLTAAERRASELETKNADLLNSIKRKLAESAIRIEAAKIGADDDLVFALVDLSKIEFSEPDEDDEIGTPLKIDRLVKQIVDKKPAVMVNQDQRKNGPPPTPQRTESQNVVGSAERDAIKRQYQRSF